MTISASGLLNHSSYYLKAADAVLAEFSESAEDLDLLEPLLYLYGHALELGLKSYLFSVGISEYRLKKKFGHELEKLLDASIAKGLQQHVVLSETDVLAIRMLSGHYAQKGLEYFVPGFKSLPKPGLFSEIVSRFVSGLEAVCTKHTLAQRERERSVSVNVREQTLKSWRDWLEQIHHEIVLLHANRRRWRDLDAMVKSNTSIPDPGYVMSWIATLYGTTQSMGIRRQADQDTRAITLARLLSEIINQPGVMSRDEYLRYFVGSDEELKMSAEREYDMFSGPGRDGIDVAIVQRDLARLVLTTRPIAQYATKSLAHLDEVRPTIPTFADLDASLDELERILKRYTLLLTGASLAKAEPMFQFDWALAFTVAWRPATGADH